MTETIFKIANLKTIALVEKIEMLIFVVSILLVMTEKLLIKSSLKNAFVYEFFINLISLIIKFAARRSSRVDAERLE